MVQHACLLASQYCRTAKRWASIPFWAYLLPHCPLVPLLQSRYLPPQMESMATITNQLFSPIAVLRSNFPSGPATSFLLPPFYSLSKVSTTPPRQQLHGSSPGLVSEGGVCVFQWSRQSCGIFRQQLRSPTRCGPETNHSLPVRSLSNQGAAHSPSQARRGTGNPACPPPVSLPPPTGL